MNARHWGSEGALYCYSGIKQKNINSALVKKKGEKAHISAKTHGISATLIQHTDTAILLLASHLNPQYHDVYVTMHEN